MKLRFIFTILLVFTYSIFSQQRSELNLTNQYYYNKLISASAFLEQISEDSSYLHIYYKLPLNNYLFKQISNNSFQSIASFTITLSDKDGVVRYHKLFNDTLVTTNTQFPITKFSFQNGYLKLNIPNKNYSLEIQVFDQNSRKSEKIKIDYQIYDSTKKNTVSVLFFEQSADNKYIPVTLQNNCNYSQAPKTIILNFLGRSINSNLSYKISKISKEDEYNLEFKTIQGNLQEIGNSEIDFNKDFVSITQESKIAKQNEQSNNNLFKIDFPSNPFVPGEYTIEIFSKNSTILTFRFKVIWDDQPLVLTNLNVALKISEIFFTDQELQQIRSLNRKQILKGIFEVWEKLDDTKGDNYPQAMMEFYKRADFAYYNFSTFAERNGALTDKGKVYILNGPPDRTEEVFKMKKLNEIWTYTNLIKEYTFESVESGVFKLVEIKE